jgi:broad specificity phosphatase PhoE
VKFSCLRHGEIESNLKKIYAGRSAEPLTPRGRRQAEVAARQLSSRDIDAIYCSPLQRTRETAEIIGSFLGITPRAAPGFIELKMGPWEGKSEEFVSREFPQAWQVWNTRPAELALPGRETLEELQGRVLSGIEKLKRASRGKNLLIVTHVAIIRVLLLHVQGLHLNFYRTLPIPNGKIFELGELS